MKTKYKILLVWLGVFTSSQVSAQQKNSIAVQTGLFHYFFDDGQIMNVKYPQHRFIFRGLLISSIALKYERMISEKASISLDFNLFYEYYYRNGYDFPIGAPIGTSTILLRDFYTYCLNYNRTKKISERFSFVYGGGLSIRFGSEQLLVNKFPFGGFGPNNEVGYEYTLIGTRKKDVAVNLLSGINYKISKRFFAYSLVDLYSTVYFSDKVGIAEYRKYKITDFPSRFDLSLKLGIGYRF